MSTIALSRPTTGAPCRASTRRAAARPPALRVRWDRVAVLAVALLAFAWFLGAGLAGSSVAEQQPADPVVVVVQPGDTLWDLARQHAPAGVATLEYVRLVEQRNGVRAGALVPGSALRLP